MAGKLKNRTRRAITLNLTTKVAPKRHVFSRVSESRDGSSAVTDRRLVLPDSITILAGSVSSSLPDSVQHCPEVAGAIQRRDVIWIQDAPSAPEAKKARREEREAEKLEEPAAEPRPRARTRS